MGTSKILIDGVGIDLTSDTVAANKLLSGITAHDNNGDRISGTLLVPNPVEWHQCPTLTKNFLDQVTYDPSDYSTSRIMEFAPGSFVPANTKPIGKTVDGVTYYNEVPNALTPFSSVNTAGTLKPLDRLRWINTSANNVRDLGGWNCDGGTVKYGKLFRGGEINSASDLNVLLNQLEIRAEIDLQGSRGGEVSVISPYVDYCCPIADDDLWAYYTIQNKAQMRQAMRFLFDSVLHGKPLYFHCTLGADRTATVAFLIESLLGMSRSDIDKEFELTSFFTERTRTTTVWKNLIGQLNAYSGTTWQDKAANYFASLGFTAAEINDFRAAMIDGTPTTLTPSISTYTVTNALTHVTSDNAAVSEKQFQSYEASIVPEDGYLIDSVRITMGGIDVTDQVWSGERVPFGEIAIEANGEHDVSWMQKANVNIPASAVTSGALNIVENGTYDVTEKKNAVVNVPVGARNAKIIEFTLSESKTGFHNILTADPDVIAHRADAGTSCLLECLDAPTDSNSVRWIYASNTLLYATYYQTRVQYVGGWGQAFGALPLKDGNNYYCIWARSNGDLVAIATAERPLLAGRYRATFMWQA